jgi:hypothetical protein
MEKSTGALGAHRPRWEPFVYAQRAPKDFDQKGYERAHTHFRLRVVIFGGPLLHGMTQGVLALPLDPFGRVYGGIGRQHDHVVIVVVGWLWRGNKEAATCRPSPPKVTRKRCDAGDQLLKHYKLITNEVM